LSIPRRDARAGEWVPGDASAEPTGAAAARATEGSKSLSVIRPQGAATSTVQGARCEEREGCSLRRGVHDEAEGVTRARTGKKPSETLRVAAEWRSTGPKGGADGDGVEGAWSSVTWMRSTSGAAPTRRGAKPLLQASGNNTTRHDSSSKESEIRSRNTTQKEKVRITSILPQGRCPLS